MHIWKFIFLSTGSNEKFIDDPCQVSISHTTGQKLQEYGHYVRIASHALYRDVVHKSGLSFYPLEGDPKKLSEWMVKTAGRLVPNILDKNEIIGIDSLLIKV